MSLSSADRAFSIIAAQRKLATKEALAAKEEAFFSLAEEGASFEQFLVAEGVIPAAAAAEVVKLRSRHGRRCEACAKETFLLPGETVATRACEHCGGKLVAPPAAAAAKPPAPAAAKPPVPAAAKPPEPEPAPAPATEPVAGPEPVAVAPPPTTARRPRVAVDGPIAGAPAFQSAAPTPPPQRVPPIERPPVERTPVARPRVERAPDPPEPVEPEPEPTSPAERFAPPGRSGPPTAPADARGPARLPFLQEVGECIHYPFRDGGLVFVTLGALFLWIGSAIASYASFAGLGLAVILFLYFHTFLFHVIERAGSGKTDMPDWPDFGAFRGAGVKLLFCWLASFMPVIVLAIGGCVLGSREASEGRNSIRDSLSVGANAHRYGGPASAYAGRDASQAVFRDENDESWRVGDRKGRWLVLALVWRDPNEKTPASEKETKALEEAEQKDGAYLPQAQELDLERLATKRKDIDVVGVVAEPTGRLLAQLRSHNGSARSTNAPSVPLVRTSESTLPDPLEAAVIQVPCVWVIDPAGKVRKAYRAGSSDAHLALAIDDLKKGGRGEPDASSGGPGVLGLLAVLSKMLLFATFFLLLWTVCLSYFPMALLMTVQFGNATLAFHYPAVIASILKTRRDYALLLVFFIGSGALLFGAWLASVITLASVAPLVAEWGLGFVGRWFYFFWQIVFCYALGRFYARNAGELGWFQVEASGPAHDATNWRPQT